MNNLDENTVNNLELALQKDRRHAMNGFIYPFVVLCAALPMTVCLSRILNGQPELADGELWEMIRTAIANLTGDQTILFWLLIGAIAMVALFNLGLYLWEKNILKQLKSKTEDGETPEEIARFAQDIYGRIHSKKLLAARMTIAILADAVIIAFVALIGHASLLMLLFVVICCIAGLVRLPLKERRGNR